MNSSKRNTSGPATSTVPFNGESKATRLTALATSSAAMGWKSTGARRTCLPFVASSAMPPTNSKNCVRHGRFFNELLLSDFRAEVAVLWKSVGPNYGHRNVMSHSRSRFVSEEVAGRSLKELHHCVIGERRRIRHVDDDLSIFE